MTKQMSTRELARSWPFGTHRDFRKRVEDAAKQWFKHKGYSTHRCGYILEKQDDWYKNIICQEVTDYIQSERQKRAHNRKGFPLHKYIHHGLSSQAMLFNLIGPLIMATKQDLSPLRVAFERRGISWPKGNLIAEFEIEDRIIFNERTQQPTSIDLVIEDNSRLEGLYIECKFVEHEFGGCSVFGSGDCDGRNPAGNLKDCYLHHIGRTYWSSLEEYGFLTGPIADNATCILTTYYQFFREVLFALKRKGEFILLADKRNPTFSCGNNGERGLFPFLKGFVPNQHKDKVHIVTIQEIVAAINDADGHGWITEFQQKYGIE